MIIHVIFNIKNNLINSIMIYIIKNKRISKTESVRIYNIKYKNKSKTYILLEKNKKMIIVSEIEYEENNQLNENKTSKFKNQVRKYNI